jgi:hypothetical protein
MNRWLLIIKIALLSSVLHAAQESLLPPYDRQDDAPWNFRCSLPTKFNPIPKHAWHEKALEPCTDCLKRKRIQVIEAILEEADATLVLLERSLNCREYYPFNQAHALTLAEAARTCRHYALITGNSDSVFEILKQLSSSRQSLFDLRETLYNLHGALYEAQGWSPHALPWEFATKIEARRSMLAGLGMIIRIATKDVMDYIASLPSANELS